MPPFEEMESVALKELKKTLDKHHRDIEKAKLNKEIAIKEYDSMVKDSEQKIKELERAIDWLEQMPQEREDVLEIKL